MSGRFVIREDLLRSANPGLRLSKFMDQENPEWGQLAGTRLDDGAYRQAYQRWERHWSSEGDRRIVLKGRVTGRLAMGLGNESVLEVGIRLNHTYGTPVIPGSAVKGVLRGRIADAGVRDFLFGGPGNAAFLAFQDAWWVPEGRSPFTADVMTVHHPDYYSRSDDTAPTDFDNPNPVQFLSVRGSFLFVVEFLGDDSNSPWKAYVEKLLRGTAEKDGIGGKRSAGYGRFQFGV